DSADNPVTSQRDSTKGEERATRSRVKHPGDDSNAYLYIVIVVSFYGVFLTGIILGYLRTKRREKRRTNAFTRLLHEEEQREWGASQKKHSFSIPAFPALQSTPVPFMLTTGRALDGGRVLAPLACALCSVEQSSVSSLSSVADVRFTIEEESDSDHRGSSGEFLSQIRVFEALYT
uniref:Potassium voltage-gated channel, Isk-related family, member 4 n=1 Tax=Cyprinus carpio TaxID=7962 RepID=A0A8C2PVX6_CYPCA